MPAGTHANLKFGNGISEKDSVSYKRVGCLCPIFLDDDDVVPAAEATAMHGYECCSF